MQNPTVCSFAFSSRRRFLGAGICGVGCDGRRNCDYAVKSNAPWITINAGNPGSGNGAFRYTVAPNPIPLTAGCGRTGTISVGDKTFTVTGR